MCGRRRPSWRRSTVDDEVGGPGDRRGRLRGAGRSCPGAGRRLRVPEVIVGRDDRGSRWVTTVGDVDPTPVLPRPRSPLRYCPNGSPCRPPKPPTTGARPSSPGGTPSGPGSCARWSWPGSWSSRAIAPSTGAASCAGSPPPSRAASWPRSMASSAPVPRPWSPVTTTWCARTRWPAPPPRRRPHRRRPPRRRLAGVGQGSGRAPGHDRLRARDPAALVLVPRRGSGALGGGGGQRATPRDDGGGTVVGPRSVGPGDGRGPAPDAGGRR